SRNKGIMVEPGADPGSSTPSLMLSVSRRSCFVTTSGKDMCISSCVKIFAECFQWQPHIWMKTSYRIRGALQSIRQHTAFNYSVKSNQASAALHPEMYKVARKQSCPSQAQIQTLRPCEHAFFYQWVRNGGHR